MMAAVEGERQAIQFSPLREELSLLEGPAEPDGAPSWTLHDQAAGRFFRLGWLEFEVLRRWHLSEPGAIAASVAAETTLSATYEDVVAVGQFLAMNDLLQRRGPAAIETLLRQVERRRPNVWQWLLKNYLFFRIPLVKADRPLERLMPYLGWIYTRGFLWTTGAVALLGLYLVTRQWDQFRTTFVSFLSPSGLIVAALGLVIAKLVHEMGHALTAKRQGCYVRTMGVAFMVMYPLLYTDVSDAWRLPDRRRRMAIGAAGMAAELVLAAYATLAWSFLPEGPVKAAAFLLATTSWVMTVLVNASPFTRFDGYFLLSDLLNIPNLHERAFALGRWWLRELLFGLGEPAPEMLPLARRRQLIALAFITWIYRFTLFIGIATLVYTLFFKLLGILLFGVEIWWFVLRPIVRELMEWMRRRQAMHWNLRSAITAGGGIVLILLAFVPWRGTVSAPAVLRASQETQIFVDEPGRLDAVLVKPGQTVTRGQILFRLSSPDLEYKIAATRIQVATLQWQSAYRNSTDSAAQQLAIQQLATARTQLQGLEAEQAKLIVAAPYDGVMAEVADPLAPGEWLPANERLGLVTNPDHAVVEAYVLEADLGRIAIGDSGAFRPDQTPFDTVAGRIEAIDTTATRLLTRRYLASSFGGDIPAREDGDHQLVPEISIYRVLIATNIETGPQALERGRIDLQGIRDSLIGSVWRRVAIVFLQQKTF